MDMIKVSVVRCEDYNEKRLTEKVLQALENLGGLENFIKPGSRVLLKPNLLNAKSNVSCITTNPHFVKVCAKIVKDFGCKPVVGDSPPLHSCIRIAKRAGLFDELKKIGVDLIEFKTPVKLKTGDKAVFKDIYVAKEVLDADYVINLPKIKSHTQMTLTGCVKNMFGTVIGREKSMWHLKAGIDKEYFSHMLLDLYHGIPPALTIADMITVMEGNGPSSGIPKDVGAIIAGDDCIAMDTVICKILNIPEHIVYTIKEAKKTDSAPSADIKNIDIISEGFDEIMKKAKGFKLPQKTELDFGIPSFVNNLLRDLLTSKPVIDKKICGLCKACEEICPVNAIKVSEEKLNFDYDKCIRCYCCQEICSYKALKVKQGTLLKILNLFPHL
jgi:uncharacterized protein (DUF362 family)/Pyruvate/2-oxoacid:ferredoxin oxidoreductase delta subunit